MAHISRFEELIAWQKARVLTREIYNVTRHGTLAQDLGLSGQMQRAAVSIRSNIAKGFERNKRGEFHPFLSIAKASCAELRSQLYVALDCDHIPQNDFDRLMNPSKAVGKIMAACGLPSNSNAIQTYSPSELNVQHSNSHASFRP